MFCPNCGANIPEDSGVCPECNTEIFVARNGGERDPFIVAEDVCDEQAPDEQVMHLLEDEETVYPSAIIEAEEELIEGSETALPNESAHDNDEHVSVSEGCRSAASGEVPKMGDGMHVFSVADNHDISTADEDELVMDEVPHGVHAPAQPPSGPSNDTPSDDTERESYGKKLPSNNRLPGLASHRRPVIVGLAVMIFVVLGIAILVYGLPGQESTDTGLVVPTPLPTAIPVTTPVPVKETAPPWTPSENLLISVSAYGGGYKVEIDGGLKVSEVETIVLTVEDKGGPHTMEWVYPSRHEQFYMARDAYNGTASATEHVTATATFTDGKKEVVFSGDL